MFDILIIGSGPAGYTCALRAGQLGKKVALIEKEKIGGVCLNLGCIPTKAYLHLTEILRRSAELDSAGIKFSPPAIDIPMMRGWVFKNVNRLTNGIEYLLKKRNCEVIREEGEIISEGKVRLKNSKEVISAQNIVLALGSLPSALKEIPFDGKSVVNSDFLLQPEEIPKSLLVVGAGAIGLEMATIYSRLGSEVIVIEIMNQILPGIDEEIAQRLQRVLEQEGIKFYLSSQILGREDEKLFLIKDREGKKLRLEAEKVLVAIGRKPNTEGLEKVGIEKDARGFIITDENFQTNLKNVFAIGDCSSPPLLAHKAMFEGKKLAEIIALGRRSFPKDYKRFIPNCIYTDPEVAVIGLSEREAKEKGLNPRVYRVPLSAIGRAYTLGRTEGFAKVVLSETGEILGFSLLSPLASELISEITLFLLNKIKVEETENLIHPHPTLSEIISETLEKILGKSIHTL